MQEMLLGTVLARDRGIKIGPSDFPLEKGGVGFT